VNWLLHWLNNELWGPMWPNIFSPSAITLAAIGVSHVKRTAQAERHHRELKDHVTAAAGTAPAVTPGQGS
jgi:hypothetical protein